MRSIFETLDQIEKRPTMYLGARTLRELELLIVGYELALHDHKLVDGHGFYREFRDYLRARFGWSMSCGPLDAIRREVGAEHAWDRFFELMHEFRAHLEPAT